MLKAFTPSIVPSDIDQTVYLVLDDLGEAGCVWRETAAEQADLETVISDLMAGQYDNPQRIIAFNVAERIADDVSADIAREMQRRADLAFEDLSSTVEGFVSRHLGSERQFALRLV